MSHSLFFLVAACFMTMPFASASSDDAYALLRSGKSIHCSDGKDIRFEINQKRSKIRYYIYDHMMVEKKVTKRVNLDSFSSILETKGEKFHFTNIGARIELDQDRDLIELTCY